MEAHKRFRDRSEAKHVTVLSMDGISELRVVLKLLSELRSST